MSFSSVSLLLVACHSAGANDDTADNGGADAITSRIKKCDDGALSSSRLQPGPAGGPDARAALECDAGYVLCRIDPKGPNEDVCGNANDCYACATPVTPRCVDNVACVKGDHWDAKKCTCVPDAKCVDDVACVKGSHWDGVACTCVPDVGCVDDVACVVGDHWDSAKCACVADLGCVDNVACVKGDHWDSTKCMCVADGG